MGDWLDAMHILTQDNTKNNADILDPAKIRTCDPSALAVQDRKLFRACGLCQSHLPFKHKI
jgi:hypothetical protein